MKRVLALLLALLMVFSFVACGEKTPADMTEDTEIEETAEEFFEYESTGDDSVKVTKYTGSDKKVGIPKTLGGYPVKLIGRWAFARCASLEAVAIPEGVTWIFENAFMECPALKTVTIPSSVAGIDASAFEGCTALKSVTISGDVKRSAFKGCTSLESVTVREGATDLGDSAFRGCSALKSVTIPASVTRIGRGTFEECTALQSITIPEGVTSIDASAFEGCKALQSVTIPSSVNDIGACAFKGTSLKSVTLPELMSFGSSMFDDCEQLETVYFASEEQKARFAEYFPSDVELLVK